jgi:2-(1,2-epoxy-1,2-dihydrophenyl)acetyl-CoA isomerase
MSRGEREVRRGDVVASFDDGVAWFRVDRPERRNALDPVTVRVLTGLLERADRDRRVRCIVIEGTGRIFCAGGDLAAALSPDEAAVEALADPWDDAPEPDAGTDEPIPLDYRWPLVEYQRLFATLWELETPVVSAVNGGVAGIGWMLALLADVVVAAAGARWAHAFGRIGMMPHAGDTVFLPRVVPLHRLNAIAMLGDPVTSEDLASWGVVHRVVDAGEVGAEADALARRLAEGPTRSFGQAKRMDRRALLPDVSLALAEERAATALVSATADRREGGAAFAEGRPARFSGA